jgi:hypothetical protein
VTYRDEPPEDADDVVNRPAGPDYAAEKTIRSDFDVGLDAESRTEMIDEGEPELRPVNDEPLDEPD